MKTELKSPPSDKKIPRESYASRDAWRHAIDAKEIAWRNENIRYLCYLDEMQKAMQKTHPVVISLIADEKGDIRPRYFRLIASGKPGPILKVVESTPLSAVEFSCTVENGDKYVLTRIGHRFVGRKM